MDYVSNCDGAIVQRSNAFDRQVLKERRLAREKEQHDALQVELGIEGWRGKAREGQVYKELQAEQHYKIDEHWRLEQFYRNCADGELHRIREFSTLRMAQKALDRMNEIDEFNRNAWDKEIKWRDYEADRERWHDRRWQRFRDNLKVPKLSLLANPINVNKIRLCRSIGLGVRKLPIHGNAQRAPCLDGSMGNFGAENMYIRK